MSKKTYKSMPSDYPICLNMDCTMAGSCLHRLSYKEACASGIYLRLVNPELCSKDAACRFYRDSKPVVYARGFKNMQNNMLPGQYQNFMFRLIGKFGRNAYFERRRGASALSPKEQKIVLEALRKVGITEDLKFDAYEENICWYD